MTLPLLIINVLLRFFFLRPAQGNQTGEKLKTLAQTRTVLLTFPILISKSISLTNKYNKSCELICQYYFRKEDKNEIYRL